MSSLGGTRTPELRTLNHGWKEMAESDGDEDGVCAAGGPGNGGERAG